MAMPTPSTAAPTAIPIMAPSGKPDDAGATLPLNGKAQSLPVHAPTHVQLTAVPETEQIPPFRQSVATQLRTLHAGPDHEAVQLHDGGASEPPETHKPLAEQEFGHARI